jgi:dienelactone hydrolase
MPSPEQQKPHVARIEIHCFDAVTLSDKQFLTGATGSSAHIGGELRLPTGAARFPAVVLLHGSAGIGANVSRWADQVNVIGAAAFLVDSFTGRGITQTVTDQSQLGSLAMIVDAYRALDLLSKHPAIDATRILLMGFSKGGFATLYAAMKRFQDMYATPASQFAAYLPFYPACNTVYIEDEQICARPVRIFHGAADNYVPVAPCREYVHRLHSRGADVELHEYPGAHHAFDNPLYEPHRSLPDAIITARCRREERPGGEIINVETGQPFRWTDGCVQHGGTVGYDAAATEKATVAVKSFLLDAFRR